MNINELERLAKEWRATCLKMSVIGRHGHLSSSLGYVDILIYLYKEWLNLSTNGSADRFVLSKGHGCTALYVAMADLGLMDKAELASYAIPGSRLPCHPCKHALPNIEVSTGSLGIGFGVASGFAKGKLLRGQSGKVVALLGDGECNEGSVWETAMFAAAHNLDNLYAVVDYNGVQAVGYSDDIIGKASLAKKFEAFGWLALSINGNDYRELNEAFCVAEQHLGPTAIIANTSSGIPFIDRDPLWHYRIPSEDEYQSAMKHLNVAPYF